MNEKRYLGDGVYVRRDPTGGLLLTTENGIRITNTIVLDPLVIEALLEYLEDQRAEVVPEPTP